MVPGATIAVPLASPFGISPAELLVNKSSSSTCDIFSISGTVLDISFLSLVKKFLGIQSTHAVRALGEIGAEVMAFVLDEIRALVGREQFPNYLPQFNGGGFAFEMVGVNLNQSRRKFQLQRGHLSERSGSRFGDEIDWSISRDGSDFYVTILVRETLERFWQKFFSQVQGAFVLRAPDRGFAETFFPAKAIFPQRH